MDSGKETSEVNTNRFVQDHPLSTAATMNTTLNQTPESQIKNFLLESHIQLLGIKFLKNDRKNFEADVHNAMSHLLHDAILSSHSESKTSDNQTGSSLSSPAVTSIDLANVVIRIPFELNESVEIVPEQKSIAKLGHMIKSISLDQELFSENVDPQNATEYLNNLLLHSIRVPVNQLFFYRGQLNSSTERCLAMTTNHFPKLSSSDDASLVITNRFQICFVLYAESPAQVTDILDVLKKLLHYQSSKDSLPTEVRAIEYKVVISAGIEIQEEVHEGKWHSCPIDKESFKLRTNLDKKIFILLHQDLTQFHYPIIKIERCFGMLLSPGRHIVSSDMVAIGLSSMIPGATGSVQQWQIIASWVPSELNFEYLNTETPRDTRVYFTIAVDLVIENIDEPVRFIFEAKAKIVSPSHSVATATEKFWQNFSSKNTKQMHEQFNLVIQQKANEDPKEKLKNPHKYEVMSCYSVTQIMHQKQRLSLQLNRAKLNESNSQTLSSVHEQKADSIETPTDEPEDEDDDEPLASGTGSVSLECSQSELDSWKDVMDKWRLNLDVRPKQLPRLVRHGVPEALRPEVWQILAGSHQDEEKLMQMYRTLVSKESTFEQVIQRDINRTFPAHENFATPGSGQESLFRICKAYSNYDTEIGYCQGLSFLVAALLLHMPEEQAFCVFVRIMFHYGLRSLYRCGLEELHCKFYQLERLLDDHMPELYSHFLDLNIETHMYASQWFLTLFTTKFPLNAVFLIIDLFLLDKMDTLLQIALALLKMSKNSLLALDFEGVMKYFRVSLPKKYRSDDTARELIRTAVKISVKKSRKYEKEYRQQLEQNRGQQQNPYDHLEKENKRLMNATIRLEQENDDLSTELLTTCKSKIKLQSTLDLAEDKAETLNTLLLNTRTQLVETEEERDRLVEEVANLKEMCRKEIEKAEKDIRSNRNIIEEYKVICTNHQKNFEIEQERANRKLCQILDKVQACEGCSSFISEYDKKEVASPNESLDGSNNSDSSKNMTLLQKITELENELIRTKVALAEAEDRNGILAGRLHSTSSELNLVRAQAEEAANHRQNTWFSKSLGKTLSSFREVTKVKSSASTTGISTNAINEASNSDTTSLYEVNSNNSNNQNRRFSSRDIYNP